MPFSCEFDEITTTFACFEQTELLRFFFFCLDEKKTGLIEKYELKAFLKSIWNNDVGPQLQQALEYLESIDADGDGTYNFRELMIVHAKYPNTFFPVFKLQVEIVRTSRLGIWWWEKHKADLIDQKEERIALEIQEIKKKQQMIRNDEKDNQEIIRARLGYFRYYCMPWLRIKESQRMQRIAIIEKELDHEIEQKMTDKKKKQSYIEDDVTLWMYGGGN